MLNPFKLIENLFYKLRNLAWEYPNFFLEENYIKDYINRTYSLFLPYSHFVLSLFLMILTAIPLGLFNEGLIVRARDKIFIEAVVMGVDDQGNVQKINKVNPLLLSNIQLEKDLVDLIYEPLIRYEYIERADGETVPAVTEVLAENVVRIKQGADYQFTLKRGVKWHDGKEFTADDVIATLNVLSGLEAQNSYVQAIRQLQWEKVDKYTVRICTKPVGGATLSCNEREDNPIFSNFLELISVKIIPAHYSGDITAANADTAEPALYKSPIGTGKFKFSNVSDTQVVLEKNLQYHEIDQIPKIDQLRFVFYRDTQHAIDAIQNGEVHALSSVSVEYLKNMYDYPQIQTIVSPVLYTQFWGMYFNLRVTPDNQAIGSEFLQSVEVRKAISAGINRESIIQDALLGIGQEAYGPIPAASEFFNSNAGWYTYDPALAEELLEKEGWIKRGTDKFRTNDQGQTLEFSLYFVNTYDRYRVAQSIKHDLETLGVKVVVDRSEQPGQDESAEGWGLQELNEQLVAPRLFDTLLYGMNTFIDPDRYELYHSSQQNHPGLNIASYKGTVETVRPRERDEAGEGSLVRLPKVDRILEQTRSFDPDTAKDERLQNYFEFQSLIAADVPVIFLYHPQFLYYVNNNVENVSLDNVSSVENRFRNISDWEVK